MAFRVLVVYANTANEPLMPMGVAILCTMLSDNGFDVRLFDTALYPASDHDDQADRVMSQQVKAADYTSCLVPAYIPN